MGSNYTEGPWEWRHREGDPFPYGLMTPRDEEGYSIYVLRPEVVGREYDENQPELSIGGANSNFALIAAAPDLLAACITALTHINPDVSDEKSERRVGHATRLDRELHKAIAKAKGGDK